MTQTAHTPGPWSYTVTPEGGTPNLAPAVFGASGSVMVCGSPHLVDYAPERYGATKKQWAANARLIAAAPDMLAALQAAAAFVADEVENRRAAGSEMSDYQDEAQHTIDQIEAAIAKATGA